MLSLLLPVVMDRGQMGQRELIGVASRGMVVVQRPPSKGQTAVRALVALVLSRPLPFECAIRANNLDTSHEIAHRELSVLKLLDETKEEHL